MKILVIVIIGIIALLVVLFAYYGSFKKLTIQIQQQGGETVAYNDIKGDYKQSGVVMDNIYYSLLDKDKIETYKGFGKYFDNPKKVKKEDLRSQAGCIIEDKDTANLESNSDRYKVMTLPTQDYITTEFPYKNKMSVVFSIMKVYPELNKYAEKNGYNQNSPVIEIYDVPNKKIMYRNEIIPLN